ncbi:sulfatase-like hydrolase/transferase [Coraliomargarita sp. W4R72]
MSTITAFAAKQPPNLLILLTDDQRLETLGAYDPDCPIPTPHLDRLASQGIRFDNGFVTTPICAVSRASILTGRYATNHRMHQFETLLPAEVFDESYNMLLEEAGYFTGQLGKYGVLITPEQRARFSYWAAQEGQGPKFRNYKGRKMHDAEWLTVKTEEFLDAVTPGKPFCLQVNYKEPHGSSAPAPEDDHLLDDHFFARQALDNPEAGALVLPFVRNSFLDVCYRQEFNKGGNHSPFLRQYFEKIVSVDRSIGEVLEMLEVRGLAENTVIVFLSDHGVHFGERQFYGKWTPYDSSLRIPFIVYDPRPEALKGAVSQEMVLNIDVAPTLLQLAGVEVPASMDGRSLAPLILGEPVLSWRSQFFYEHFLSPASIKYIPRNEGIRTLTEKYVRWIDPQCDQEEFYDLVNDADEAENLINHPEFQARIEAVRQEFASWRAQHPSTYSYDVYGRRAQSLAPEIDWEAFKKARPEEYARIAAQIERFGVTWEQAEDDWAVRYKISSHAGYWY